MSKIYARSVIIYVCDMSNFEGSIVPEILRMVEKDHHKLIIVANKIDALPKGFKMETLHKWVKSHVGRYFDEPDKLESF